VVFIKPVAAEAFWPTPPLREITEKFLKFEKIPDIP
jgi:hypothetical protein